VAIWLTLEVSPQRSVVYQLQTLPDPLVIGRRIRKVDQPQDFTAALDTSMDTNKGLNLDAPGRPSFGNKVSVLHLTLFYLLNASCFIFLF
jgi:hypothetical protein